MNRADLSRIIVDDSKFAYTWGLGMVTLTFKQFYILLDSKINPRGAESEDNIFLHYQQLI
jgi:hypothetical protein